MRISDWSSDVCSSDLAERAVLRTFASEHNLPRILVHFLVEATERGGHLDHVALLEQDAVIFDVVRDDPGVRDDREPAQQLLHAVRNQGWIVSELLKMFRIAGAE